MPVRVTARGGGLADFLRLGEEGDRLGGGAEVRDLCGCVVGLFIDEVGERGGIVADSVMELWVSSSTRRLGLVV